MMCHFLGFGEWRERPDSGSGCGWGWGAGVWEAWMEMGKECQGRADGSGDPPAYVVACARFWCHHWEIGR